MNTSHDNMTKNYKINSLPVLLKNPKILLIGGGKIALQKAQVLYNNNIEFIILSEKFIQELSELNCQKFVKLFEASDLKGFNIIINATGNKIVEEIIDKAKLNSWFLLNTVDVPEKCDFYFSALLNYGKLKIAVSSDGASPTISKVVRDKIKNIISSDIHKLVDNEAILRSNKNIDVNRVETEVKKLFGKVFLVGAGPGDPDLLTIKAFKILQSAEVILHDYLVSDEILSLANPTAIIINCGKPHGSTALTQTEINSRMILYANQGKRVVRLKGGDPFIFGRLVEETQALLNNCIDFEIVPGITSSISGAGNAAIPVTARDVSNGFSVVSGCLKGNHFNMNWIQLLNIPKHTTLVLMGLNKTKQILSEALKHRVRINLPVAIISNATMKNQTEIITTLNNLEEAAKNAPSPAIIVFGDVVNLRNKLRITKKYTEEQTFASNLR